MTNYFDLSIEEINNKLKNKEIKPIDLVNEAFEKAESNSKYNAFITLNKEEAIKKAKELENKEVDNLLFGIPIAIKDNILTKDLRTTCGSKMLDDFIPIYDATVIEKLKGFNAIIIGKTNMDEFAMGSTNETSYYGPVLNSIDDKKVSGGSSGGSAVVVAKKIVPLSLGSDTGGSIRQPAAYNNIIGIKPTYGRVSRYGLASFSSSLDQIGHFSNNVLDSAILLNCISGLDSNDLTSSNVTDDFTLDIGKDIKGMKVCIPSFYLSEKIDIKIRDGIQKVVAFLKNNQVTVDVVDVSLLEFAVPLYQTIGLAEASSNLARYDGIRYGYRTDKKVKDVDSFYKYTRSEGFGEEVKRRIMIGAYVLSGKNVDVYYNKALAIRNKLSKNLYALFNDYDLILGPTTTGFPYDLGFNRSSNDGFLDDILTIPFNMSGLPAMSFPIDNQKPIGLQIVANMFDEKTIYKFAAFLEKHYERGE